jgi:biopolymer transport protein TolR
MAMLIKGGKGRGGRRRPIADINVTPMVDVMLVLLVVFMITAPMLAAGVNVSLPKVSAEQMPPETERPLVVTIDKDGGVYVNERKETIELKELAPLLKALAENNLEKRVFIRADQEASYGSVVTILALLQEAGFRNAGLPVDPADARRVREGG